MNAARIEHAVDARADEDEKGEHEVDHLAASLACRARGCLRRVLILLWDLEMCVGFFNALSHGAEVASRPDDEEHKENREPCVKVEWNCLQEEHKAIDGRVLRQGRANCRRPAGNGGDDTDRCRRRVDDVGELCARDLKLVRDGTHDGADGEAVEVVVDEDDDAEQHGDERGAALPLDRACCPLAVGIHRTRARDGGDEDAEDDEKD